MDDVPNFFLVRRWINDEIALRQVLFELGPWIDKRSVSMASFALSAHFGGYDPFPFKLGNLVLHLVCGALIYAVLSRLLRRDAQLQRHASLAAAMVAAIWLLHPLHASTVLYAVQRMAQLGAFFCLLAIWLYIWIRERMEQGQVRAALILFLAVPLLLLLAIQSKPNAAVLPLLLLVVEISYFSPARRLPTSLYAFFSLFVALPAIAGLVGLVIAPQALLDRYAEYDFNASERLLSQPRVLFAYISQLVAPNPVTMGVFTDGYVVSRGLLSPPTTLVALIALFGVSLLAWRMRNQSRGFIFGWSLFLAAHFIESVVAPVELYYEHRNYLPSIGVFVALVSLATVAGEQLASRGVRIKRIGLFAASAALLVLAVQTHGRARIWADPLLLPKAELAAHPNSVRALVNYIGVAQTVGDLDRAYAAIDEAFARPTSDRVRAHAFLTRAWLDCVYKRASDPADVYRGVELSPHLDILKYFALHALTSEVEKGICGPLDREQMARTLQRAADLAHAQPDTLNLKWALRNQAALFYADSGNWSAALPQARLGWQPTTPGEGAAHLAEILLVNGHADEADKLLKQARSRASTPEARRQLDAMLPFVETERASPGWTRRRMAAGSSAIVSSVQAAEPAVVPP